MRPTVALIVLGGLIILGAIASSAVRHERGQERVAEFYRTHSNAAVLPDELRTTPISLAEACGFATGGVMVLAGIWRSRTPATSTAE
jgi:hypothetical protein